MIFVREVRSKVSKANPDMPVLQIMKEVGKKWQSLNPNQKKVYQDMADADKVRYKSELKEFEKEVEKLQVTKPSKGRSYKNKKANQEKVEDIKPVQKPVPKLPEPSLRRPKMPEKETQQTKSITIDLSNDDCDSILKPAVVQKMNSINNTPTHTFMNPKESFKSPQVESKIFPTISLVKDDNLIKRPLNILKSESYQMLPKTSQVESFMNYERPRHKMQPEPYFMK